MGERSQRKPGLPGVFRVDNHLCIMSQSWNPHWSWGIYGKWRCLDFGLLTLPLGKVVLRSLQCQYPSASLTAVPASQCQRPKDNMQPFLSCFQSMWISQCKVLSHVRNTPKVIILCSFPAFFKRHVVTLHCREPWDKIEASRAPSLAPLSDLSRPHFSEMENGNAHIF